MRPDLEAIATPEMMLLCSVARLEMDEASLGLMDRALDRGIDWERLRPLAEFHGLRPLLNRHLGGARHSRCPARVVEWLAHDARHIAARNLYLSQQLVRVSRECRAAGVRAVFFKGPLAAREAYGSVALREFLDLDLLVRRRDVERVRGVIRGCLEAAGPPPPDPSLFYYGSSSAVPVPVRDGAVFEVHWRLAPTYARLPISVDDALREARESMFLGQAVPRLEDYHRVVYLAFHGTRHCWAALEWLLLFSTFSSRLRTGGQADGANTDATLIQDYSEQLSASLLGREGGPQAPQSRRETLTLADVTARQLLTESPTPREQGWRAMGRFLRAFGPSLAVQSRYVLYTLVAPQPADRLWTGDRPAPVIQWLAAKPVRLARRLRRAVSN